MIKRIASQCWPLNRHIVYRLSRPCGSAVALTFDDGPDPAYTPRILAILAAHRAVATFFLLGNACRKYPELVEQIHKAGHAIGSHGMDHSSHELPRQARDFGMLLRAMQIETQLFRPPRGMLPIRAVPGLLAGGWKICIWSHDRQDSLRHEGKVARATPELETITARDIVLMHDDNPVCLEELPHILAALQRRGLHTTRLDANGEAGT